MAELTLPGDDNIKWPLRYQIRPSQTRRDPQGNIDNVVATNLAPLEPLEKWWSHKLYRCPNHKPVEVLYSASKITSEALAKQFLDEPILGFDMEWFMWAKPTSCLQEQISLIQLACEDKIGLFHIGLHSGSTPDELIAPSLKKILESPKITKVGVAIMNADGKRLVEYFNIKPQSMFELSHLHRLVTFGPKLPGLVNTKLWALDKQVEEHLGLPLLKEETTRKGNWSKRLNQKQQDYAAADAYAGFMLYHCMNHKRKLMVPSPPLPLYADSYLPFRFPKVFQIRLHSADQTKEYITPEQFWGSAMPAGTVSGATAKRTPKSKRVKNQETNDKPPDAHEKILFERLAQSRRSIAHAAGLKSYIVAHDNVLRDIAKHRPATECALGRIRGIGPEKLAKYGAGWLEIISQFLKDYNLSSNAPVNRRGPAEAVTKTPVSQAPMSVTLSKASRRRPAPNTPSSRDILSSSPPFKTPLSQPPQLHTGLTSLVEGTRIDGQQVREESLGTMSGSKNIKMGQSDELQSPTFSSSSSSNESNSKRKRSPTPTCRTSPRTSPGVLVPVPAQPRPQSLLTPRSRKFHSALTALGRRAATKLKRPLESVVSASTIQLIVASPPRTEEELQRIHGISSFVQACGLAGFDLMKVVSIHAPALS
ncbi:hypothetical protein GQ43DRAFT_365697 [Delitschia confertaspora ATCC 74209]|uniref:HRDC domain-containing protein n=1 Tax=Delitschia confertaspora ATCC 74209 TaxID=1513339 RepID=A0A9P4MVB6_9PLEO|nr:hypothetical protein GQ43DRAFT_365697 [Delitschia confertaspora ATCC 74209]